MVGYARGEAEVILPEGMPELSAFPMLWRREGDISWE